MSTIKSSGENLKLSSDNTKDVEIQHNGTTHVTVKSDGNVGIGTTNPDNKLTVYGNITQLDGSPEYHFATSSSTHYNWRVAVQEQVNGGFEIASGTQTAGTNANSDTYTNRFVIDSAGRVTMPYQPAWRLQPNFSNNSSNSAHYIPFAHTSSNGTFITSATVNSAGRVTIPVTGKYSISACFRAENSPSDVELEIHINGSRLQRVGIWYNAQPYESISISGIFSLSANDYIEIRLAGNTASNNYSGYNDELTFFQGHLIG
jgi:hypothetical protein